MRSARIISAFLFASLLVLPLGAVENTSEKEITRGSVVDEMNRHRAKHDLPPLRADDRLNGAAEARIDDMERQGYWGHYPPDGSSPFLWLSLNGYHYRQAGENLAAGLESVDVLVSSWMSSPGHRANILSPTFQDVGIAIIDGGTTGRRSGRSIVVLFAVAKSARAK